MGIGEQSHWRLGTHYDYGFEFSPTITPKKYNFCIDLHFNGLVNVLEKGRNHKTISDKEDPSKTTIIINESYKPPFSKRGRDFEWTLTSLWIKVKGYVGYMVIRERKPDVVSPEYIHHKTERRYKF